MADELGYMFRTALEIVKGNRLLLMSLSFRGNKELVTRYVSNEHACVQSLIRTVLCYPRAVNLVCEKKKFMRVDSGGFIQYNPA